MRARRKPDASKCNIRFHDRHFPLSHPGFPARIEKIGQNQQAGPPANCSYIDPTFFIVRDRGLPVEEILNRKQRLAVRHDCGRSGAETRAQEFLPRLFRIGLDESLINDEGSRKSVSALRDPYIIDLHSHLLRLLHGSQGSGFPESDGLVHTHQIKNPSKFR